jgi:hypothetical protein
MDIEARPLLAIGTSTPFAPRSGIVVTMTKKGRLWFRTPAQEGERR